MRLLRRQPTAAGKQNERLEKRSAGRLSPAVLVNFADAQTRFLGDRHGYSTGFEANYFARIWKPAKAVLLDTATNEVVFAVVGYVGSGTSEIATAFKGLLEQEKLEGGKFEVEVLKARKVISDWASRNGHRCAYRKIGRYCSNTREQNSIIDGLISDIPELELLSPIRKNALKQELRDGRIGDLLEFSRAVHAEMEAVIAAARKGVSTVGAKLFVTTFPCHYCARGIVAAGIDEVQYVEPYPKSQALALHADAITVDAKDRKQAKGRRKVLFRPFTGVAPRLYRRAFLKDRDLKDFSTGDFRIGTPEWGSPWQIHGASYVELEAALARTE
jgi:deoxycytidylate deaminase